MSYKSIKDALYSDVVIDSFLLSIVDTPQFQRLKRVKQLALVSHVFSSAEHSRFAHSIGVCHLATQFMHGLARRQPELGITPRQIQLVGCAGLVHDLGHGPFSHAFDTLLLPNLKEHEMQTMTQHEERSCFIFRYLVKKYQVAMTLGEVETVCRMVCPRAEDGFLFQIVCNARSGIDVDKLDYIRRDCHGTGLKFDVETERILAEARVIEGTICWPLKLYRDISAVYTARRKLHEICYNHPVVVGIELLVADVLILAAKGGSYNVGKWIAMAMLHSDSVLERIRNSNCEELLDARLLLLRLDRRQLYKKTNEVSPIYKRVVSGVSSPPEQVFFDKKTQKCRTMPLDVSPPRSEIFYYQKEGKLHV